LDIVGFWWVWAAVRFRTLSVLDAGGLQVGHCRILVGAPPPTTGYRAASNSAIWMAFSAAPLRKLSLLTKNANPLSPS
jgi:hypothetical protein